jgi:hypothetical protein
VFAHFPTLVTEAGLVIRTFSFGETKIDEDAALGGRIVEEVGGLDISVEDLVVVYALESSEKLAEVYRDLRNGHVAEVGAEIPVTKVREDGDDLVGVPEGGDQGADGGALAEVVEKLELVKDSGRAGGDIDLLDGDVSCLATGSLNRAAWLCVWRWRPL